MKCVDCGQETETVRLRAPIDKDVTEDEYVPMCEDCWNDYIQQVSFDQAYHDVLRNPDY